jgi:hypothetical protein
MIRRLTKAPPSNALLVRVGIDQAFGGWNAPADPETGEFVYVPIPEGEKARFHPGCERRFEEAMPALEDFASPRGLGLISDLKMPPDLAPRAMHLDPDFATLTYGDVGDKRGAAIRAMGRGDLLVFYAGLRSISPAEDPLIYALVGLFTIDEVLGVADVPASRRHENAHTRKLAPGATDIVARAQPGRSGRLRRLIQIGEYRNRAYRVTHQVLDAWGGLGVKDGYIQRSAVPPKFLDPERFLRWFESQHPELMRSNW